MDNQLTNPYQKKNVTFSSAFKLLRNANVTKKQKLLILKETNYGNKATLVDKAKKSLKKFIGACGHTV